MHRLDSQPDAMVISGSKMTHGAKPGWRILTQSGLTRKNKFDVFGGGSGNREIQPRIGESVKVTCIVGLDHSVRANLRTVWQSLYVFCQGSSFIRGRLDT